MTLKIETIKDPLGDVFVPDCGVDIGGKYIDLTNFTNHGGFSVAEVIAQGINNESTEVTT